MSATERQPDVSAGLWARVCELPVAIERVELEPLSVRYSADFERRTTVVHLHGEGQEGVGEDVIYDPDLHVLAPIAAPASTGAAASANAAGGAASTDAAGGANAAGAAASAGAAAGAAGPGAAGAVAHPLVGEMTLASFSARLAQLDLFGGVTPEQPAYRRYRIWAYESAALDLALRQAGTTLHAVLGMQAQPVRFVVSTRLGDPASLEAIERRLKIAPQMRFKLDPTLSWDDAFVASLAELDVVDSVDLKGFYEGTIVDNPADPDLYRRVAEAFPDAWIEDPKLTPETEAVLAPHLDRLTWDAPIHEVADIEALAHKPRCINVKPSRIGGLADLFAVYEHCEAQGIACYGGGQSELGPGRGQIQYLASLFHPGASNDVAPSGWNLPSPPAGLPGSPLAPAPAQLGFRWEI